jgi:RNA polymerase sigma-70 factor (ECF subfamily)
MSSPLQSLIDHLFRHSAGQMVATLTRVFGPTHLELAEEVVQEALLTALQQWGIRGVPDNPRAWLFQVARNRALDRLRRDASLRAREPEILAAFAGGGDASEARFAHEVDDDALRMMFMCCHPSIPPDSRVALTLKIVAGFSVDEIARAFLGKKDAIAQRLVRAKRLIREETIPLEFPTRTELPSRLTSVLDVLYLVFNEGYAATGGTDLVRTDLCIEAIRMTRALAGHPATASPEADALLALMLLQSARLPARVDDAGELTTLEQQDRSRWDGAMMAEGFRLLGRASRGERLTPWHVEAAIAACHAAAPSFAETDWPAIVHHYEQLMTMRSSPVVAVNHAVAVAMASGPEAGLAELARIADDPSLANYLPLHVARGELALRAGDRATAEKALTRALELPATLPEKRHVLRSLERLKNGG